MSFVSDGRWKYAKYYSITARNGRNSFLINRKFRIFSTPLHPFRSHLVESLQNNTKTFVLMIDSIVAHKECSVLSVQMYAYVGVYAGSYECLYGICMCMFVWMFACMSAYTTAFLVASIRESQTILRCYFVGVSCTSSSQFSNSSRCMQFPHT